MQGEWQARVKVVDEKRPSKSPIPLSVQFRAHGLEKLRIDLTTLSGFYVGSVLVEEKKFKALMARDRKFYSGPATAEVMKKILRLPVDPVWLSRLLFEQPDESWKCEIDSRNYLKSCTDEKHRLTVEWKNRALSKRDVSIKIANYKIDFSFHEFSEEITQPEKAFVLSAPPAFRHIKTP